MTGEPRKWTLWRWRGQGEPWQVIEGHHDHPYMAPENAAREIIVHHVVESHPDRRREQEGARGEQDPIIAKRQGFTQENVERGTHIPESVPDSLQPDPEDREARCSCDWTAGTQIMPGTENTGYPMPNASRITDPNCPVHGRPERCPSGCHNGLLMEPDGGKAQPCPDPWHLHGEREDTG